MAGKATVTAGIDILNGTHAYRNYPTQFQVTLSQTDSGAGPYIGSVDVPVIGIDVSLAELTRLGGLALIRNADATNYMTVGISDGTEFFPFQEVWAGEHYPLRFSRHLGKSFESTGTSTGTFDTGAYSLHLRADSAPVIANVLVFER